MKIPDYQPWHLRVMDQGDYSRVAAPYVDQMIWKRGAERLEHLSHNQCMSIVAEIRRRRWIHGSGGTDTTKPKKGGSRGNAD